MKQSSLPETISPIPVLPPAVAPRLGLKTCWLAHFVITCRAEQLPLSARILGMTPQALRRSLEGFADFMSGALFRFDGPRLLLTQKGLQLLADLAPVFDNIDRLKAEVRSAHRLTQVLNQGSTQETPLGCPPLQPNRQPLVLGFEAGFFGEAKMLRLLLSALAPQQPLIQRSFQDPAALALALQAQQVDLAFSVQPLDCPTALKFQGPLSPFVIVSAPQALRSWSDWQYALAPAALRPGWQAELPPAQVSFESSQIRLLIQRAQSGDCAVCLPALAIEAETQNGSLAVVALPPFPSYFRPCLSLIAREQVAPFIRPLVEAGFLLDL